MKSKVWIILLAVILVLSAVLSVVLLAVTGLIISIYSRLGGKSSDLGLF